MRQNVTKTQKEHDGNKLIKRNRGNMKIYEFTIPELDYYKRMCNFTAEQRKLFELRSNGVPPRTMRGTNECIRFYYQTD